MAVTSEAVVSAASVAHFLVVFALLVFGFLRSYASTRRFYAPKRYDTKQHPKPRRLANGYIVWIWQIVRISEDEIISVAGLDAAVYLRVIRMSWYIFLLVTIWCCAVILPINLTGGEVDNLLDARHIVTSAPPSHPRPPSNQLAPSIPELPPRRPYAPAAPSPPLPPEAPNVYCTPEYDPIATSDVAIVDKLSLTNIPPHSHKLLAHLFSVYVISVIVLLFLWKYNSEMTVLRILFLANAPKGGPSHTVLVQDIPGVKYGTIPWTMRQILDGTVLRVLPATWRDKLVEVADDVFFRGVEYAWRKARAAASKARALGNSGRMESMGGGSGGFDHFSYSRVAAEPAVRRGSSQEMMYGSVITRQGVAQSTSVPKALQSDAASFDGGRPTDGDDPARASDGVDPVVRAYAIGLDVDVDPPHQDKVKVANLKSRGLDVWAIAEDFLRKPRETGKQQPTFWGMVEAEFVYVYGRSAVAAVNPVWDQSELDPLIAEFDSVRTQLEDYIDWAAVALRRRKKVKPKMVGIVPMIYGNWGARNYGNKPIKVPALDFWAARLQYLAEEIGNAKVRAEGVRVTPAAFVTFNSRVAQVIAATALHQHTEAMWHVVPAPEPGEVLWTNVKMRAWERAVRSLLHWGLYFLLLATYMLPVTAIQGLIAVPKVNRPNKDGKSEEPVLTAALQSIIPGIVLKLFLRLLPYLLELMCRYTGFVSLSEVDFAVVRRCYAFQVLVLFLGSLVTGSFLNQVEQILKAPAAIIRTMATSVPQVATFFVTYVLVAGLGGYAVTLLRPIRLVAYFIQSRLVTMPRQRARLWAEHYTSFSGDLAEILIVFLLGIVFCIVNPIMSCAVFSYLTFALVFELYDNLYVHKRKYESGGQVWSIVFHAMVAALYFMQTMIMLIISLKGYAPAVLVVPIIVLTVIFHIVCTKVFSRPWSALSLHDASYLDYKDRRSRSGGSEALTEAEKAAIRHMYLSPAFKRSETGIRDLLVETEKTKRLIAGEPMQSILDDFTARGIIDVTANDAACGGNEQLSSGTDSDCDEAPGRRSGHRSRRVPVTLQLAGRGTAATGDRADSEAGGTEDQPPGDRARRPQARVRFWDGVGGRAAGHKTEPNSKADTGSGRAVPGRKLPDSSIAIDVSALARPGPDQRQGGITGAGGSRSDAVLAPPPQAAGTAVPAGSSQAASPETALALVSALVAQVCAMDTSGQEELQALLQGHPGASSGSAGGARASGSGAGQNGGWWARRTG